MIPIHFKALYQPNQRKFLVIVKFGKKTIREKMTISHFLKMARESHKPLVIGGITIQFEQDDGTALKAVRDYFTQVANSYTLKYWGKPNKNN